MREAQKEIILNKNGPIIIIEDDVDDQEILLSIFQKLDYHNEIIFYKDGNEALEYLNRTDVQPFLIGRTASEADAVRGVRFLKAFHGPTITPPRANAITSGMNFPNLCSSSTRESIRCRAAVSRCGRREKRHEMFWRAKRIPSTSRYDCSHCSSRMRG